MRAYAYEKLLYHQKSIADCDTAIILDPKNVGAYGNRGYAYSNMGRYEDAIKDYTQLLALNPKAALTYNYRGYAYLKLKKYKEALDDYDAAIKIGGTGFKPDYEYRGEAAKALAAGAH
jgi:tetratricopeptide (TPR) repeat protein